MKIPALLLAALLAIALPAVAQEDGESTAWRAGVSFRESFAGTPLAVLLIVGAAVASAVFLARMMAHPRHPDSEIQKAQSRINSAWICGLLDAFTFALMAMWSPALRIASVAGACVLVLGLAFGIKHGSKVCAIILFLLRLVTIAVALGVNPWFALVYAPFAAVYMLAIDAAVTLGKPLATPMSPTASGAMQSPVGAGASIPPVPLRPQAYRVGSDGADFGELPLSTIRQLIKSGKLTGDDFYYAPASLEWRTLSRLAEVEDCLTQAPQRSDFAGS